jgi:sugar/nucleoside kinase (ribokinase family)
MNVVCVGDCGIDHYIQSGDRRPGGITSNFALQARRCFDETDAVSIIAPLGDDEEAIIVQRRFENSGIECHFESLSGSTPIQHIEIESSGERTFVAYEEGVLRDFRITNEHATRVGDADLAVAPVFQQNRDMFSSFMSVTRGGLTAVDFADFSEHPDFDLLERHANQLDIAFFGLRARQENIIAALQAFAAKHNVLLVVTLGADGSRAFQSTHTYASEAIPVDRVVDTTGAGDAFAAGFLACYCRASNIEQSLLCGATTAARIVQQHGAN